MIGYPLTVVCSGRRRGRRPSSFLVGWIKLSPHLFGRLGKNITAASDV